MKQVWLSVWASQLLWQYNYDQSWNELEKQQSDRLDEPGSSVVNCQYCLSSWSGSLLLQCQRVSDNHWHNTQAQWTVFGSFTEFCRHYAYGRLTHWVVLIICNLWDRGVLELQATEVKIGHDCRSRSKTPSPGHHHQTHPGDTRDLHSCTRFKVLCCGQLAREARLASLMW